MRRQACLGDMSITVVKQGPCGKFPLQCITASQIYFSFIIIIFRFFITYVTIAILCIQKRLPKQDVFCIFLDKECTSAVDIAFIIDSSGSIGRRNWERVKRFVKALVSKLDVSNSATRVAAIAYSTNPEVVMQFKDYQGTDEVNRGFDGMKYQRGYTYTDKALKLADQALFQTSNGMRISVPKVYDLKTLFIGLITHDNLVPRVAPANFL